MMKAKCKIMDFPKVTEGRGNLTYIENNKEAPFDIRRVYYLYDVPSSEMRGGHAHKALTQILIAINGSFNVEVDDGHEKTLFHLNRPHQGLYIPPMFWRELSNFSAGGVCLVLASELYKPEDYIRTYDEFKNEINKQQKES